MPAAAQPAPSPPHRTTGPRIHARLRTATSPTGGLNGRGVLLRIIVVGNRAEDAAARQATASRQGRPSAHARTQVRPTHVAQREQKLLVEETVEDEVEGEVAVDEQVGDDAEEAVEVAADEIPHRLGGRGEEGVRHRAVGEGGGADADEEEADDADAGDRHAHLFAGVRRLGYAIGDGRSWRTVLSLISKYAL